MVLQPGVLAALGVPLLIDVTSCVLAIRKQQRGRGPSGFPIVTLGLYALVVFGAGSLTLLQRLSLMLGCVAVHVLLVFAVPAVYRA
jgi:hypothetical protein